MTGHMLAEVEVFDPESCHVLPHVTDGWELTDVARSDRHGSEGEVVIEFTLRGESGADPPPTQSDRIERVYAFENEYVFRVFRPATRECACQRIEREGCVVRNVYGDDDSLVLTFFVTGTEKLRTVIGELEGTAESVSLRRLVKGVDSPAGNRPTTLDLGVLTERQEEVLRVAAEMGYFRTPREATAGEVADELGIATTTFTEHLAAAQRNVFEDVLFR